MGIDSRVLTPVKTDRVPSAVAGSHPLNSTKEIPQIQPTCTRLNPMSVEISLIRTGMHIDGMDVHNALVIAARFSTYHR